ncbi:MAG: histidine phosphatase family protein [Vagococcus sp.]
MSGKIYLIRHGETELNKQKCFYGALDVPINDSGRQQAERIKRKLIGINIDKVVSSGALRARETSQLIFPEKKVEIDTRLNEKGFGDWEGLNATQIEKRYASDWWQWIENPFDFTPPNAESFQLFQNRVLQAFDEQLSGYSGTIAYVSHLGVIRVIVSHVCQTANFWDITVEQDAWIELNIGEDGEITI